MIISSAQHTLMVDGIKGTVYWSDSNYNLL